MNIEEFKTGMIFEAAFPSSAEHRRWLRIIEVEPGNKKIVYHMGFKSAQGPFYPGVRYSTQKLDKFFKGHGVGTFMLVWEP